MIYYIIFSYLFLLGARAESESHATIIPWWNVLIAPIVLPNLLGQWIIKTYYNK